MPSTRNVGVPITNLMVAPGADAAGDFDVEIGFAVIARQDALVLAGIDEHRIVDRQIEHLAVGLHVAQQNVGPAHDADRTPVPLIPCASRGAVL